MPATLTVRDETTAGQTLHEFVLELLTERVTVHELIRSRVYQEVQDYNRRRPAVFKGLVQLTEAEQRLNGAKTKRPPPLDWKKQFEKAVEAFRTHRILILVNERQMERLDEEIFVESGTCVTFLRLVPLIGG